MQQVTEVVVIDRLPSEPGIWWRHGDRTCAASKERDVHRLLGAQDLRRVATKPDVRGKKQQRRQFNEEEISQPSEVDLPPPNGRHPCQCGANNDNADDNTRAERCY